MLIRFLTLLAALAPLTFADVEFVTPDAGASVAGGGKTLTVEWKESGEKPPISSLTTYTIFLCAGGNDAANQVRHSARTVKKTVSAACYSSDVQKTDPDRVWRSRQF